MRCPSCGASYGASGFCNACQATPHVTDVQEQGLANHPDRSDQNTPPAQRSTLIEFPGVVRSTVPQWRRELSERVREVQERRAREAAIEAAEAERRRLAQAAAPRSFELLRQGTAAPVNPLVAAALRRIERANQRVPPVTSVRHGSTAAAVAYVPEEELRSPRRDPLGKPAKAGAQTPVASAKVATAKAVPSDKPKSVPSTPAGAVVPAKVDVVRPKAQKKIVAKGLINDHDAALDYLSPVNPTLSIQEINERRATVFPRIMSALLDIFVSVVLFSPVAGALQLTAGGWPDFQTAILGLAGGAFTTFIYLTCATALTGRTLGMRLLSLRIVDRQTGLIPTGAQSACRALFYLGSLFVLGLPIVFAMLNRDGYTPHDRLTNTVIVHV